MSVRRFEITVPSDGVVDVHPGPLRTGIAKDEAGAAGKPALAGIGHRRAEGRGDMFVRANDDVPR